MKQPIPIREASSRLDELVDNVAAGQKVIIARDDGSTFEIVSAPSGDLRPTFGSAKGLIEVAPDFDEPLDDFEEYGP